MFDSSKDTWIALFKEYLKHVAYETPPDVNSIKCMVRYAMREAINYDLISVKARPPTLASDNLEKISHRRRFRIVSSDRFYIKNNSSHFIIGTPMAWQGASSGSYPLAHEIAHTYFYNIRAYKIRRISNFLSSEEHIVNQLAEEILVPSYSIVNTLGVTPSIYSLMKQPSIYHVSLSVILKQVYYENLLINKCGYVAQRESVKKYIQPFDFNPWMRSLYLEAKLPLHFDNNKYSINHAITRKYQGYLFKNEVKRHTLLYLYEYIYSDIAKGALTNSDSLLNTYASRQLPYGKDVFTYSYTLRPYDNFYYIQILISY